MQELSMNLLDIAQNSVAAGSTLTQITIAIDTAAKRLTLTIADNGKGMDEETVRRVTDPFYTTRTTRKVGLGLPLFQEAARATGGELTIRSAVGKGTTVEAFFTLGHIDLAPLGDLGVRGQSPGWCSATRNWISSTGSSAMERPSAWTPASCGRCWTGSPLRHRRLRSSCGSILRNIPKIY